MDNSKVELSFFDVASMGLNLVSSTVVAGMMALINYRIKMLSLSKPAVVSASYDDDDDDEEDI